MNMPEHLDAEAIYALLEGELEPGRERAAEAHLWRCDACRALREDCAATLGGLRWYGEQAPAAPEGYWDGFWARWPLAGGLEARRRSAGATTRRVGTRWAAATATAAAVAILVGGAWWAADRRGLEAEDLTAHAAARLDPSATTAAHELVAGTAWEDDVDLIRRVTFTIGSVDPLSKGVVLASMAEQP